MAEGKAGDDFSDFSGDESSQDGHHNLGQEDDDEEEDEEDDSDFDASFADSDVGKKGAKQQDGTGIKIREVENQPYDAKVDLEDSFSDESIDTNDGTMQNAKMRALETEQDHSDAEDHGDSPPRDATSPGLGKGNLSETEEIPGSLGSESKNADKGPAPSKKPIYHNDDDEDEEDDDEDDDGLSDEETSTPRKNAMAGVKLEAQTAYMQDAARRAAESSKAAKKQDSDEEEDDDEDDEDESSTTSNPGRRAAAALPGGYNASDYHNLDVSSEVQELFQYIGRYKPHDLELDSKLKCFIPDFIPAVGQIDAFVKIPRPTLEPDHLGLKVLDEPSANQSDATVLDLQLRAISKKSVKNPMIVRSIENANKDKKAVQGWIDSIKELHRSKPMPTVHYTRQMPDIESLMQVWPEEVETLLRELHLPSADIDLDLKDYARVVCAVLDIPVFTSMVESLHVLFTLYTEFKNNQHFQRVSADPAGSGAMPQDDYF